MKILHTADWHLGHRLHENSQYEEQKLFLNWLGSTIQSNKIDLLLVSGDVFDTGVPSSQSLKLYFDFLVNLIKTDCKHIVITGGNHDSPGTINAPKELLNTLSIKVVGKSTGNIEDEVFTLSFGDEKLVVAATPYLRDQDIRRAVEGESFDDITDRYKQALVNHYNTAAEYCATLEYKQTPVIAMGHLFAVGGSVSDSEQSIYVGTLGHIGADDFPKMFDYIALGHLHRSQIVGGKDHIRYSGSPNILSFSEVGYDKNVIILSIEKNKLTNIEELSIPKFREVVRINGKLDDCISQLHTIKSNDYQLTPWVEVVLDDKSNTTIGSTDIYKAVEGLPLEVLTVSLKDHKRTEGIESLVQNVKNIRELTPMEVFEMKCKEEGFVIKENQEVLDAFSEALQIAQEDTVEEL
jgi:exonuclease SbcD